MRIECECGAPITRVRRTPANVAVIRCGNGHIRRWYPSKASAIDRAVLMGFGCPVQRGVILQNAYNA